MKCDGPRAYPALGRLHSRSLCLAHNLRLPKGFQKLTAEEIRKLFVLPVLAVFAEEETISDARSLTLATWELAAQLAEFNQRFHRMDEAAAEADTQEKK